MIQFGEIGTLLMSNVLAALIGFLLGQLVQWRHAKIRGHQFVVPTVRGGQARSYRLAGSVLALLAVLTVGQSVYTAYQVEEESKARQESAEAQIECNRSLLEQLTVRAEEWTEDHRNTTQLIRELDAALALQDNEDRFDRLLASTQRYLAVEKGLRESRENAPLRTPNCP